MQRWAIAPPALDDETDELEELALVDTGHELDGRETTAPPSSQDDPEVQALPSGWRSEERDTRITVADEVGPRSSLTPSPISASEPEDTIPAPPWLGDE